MNKKLISPYSSLLFHLSHIDFITYPPFSGFQKISAIQPTMIIFVNNSIGTLSIDDKPYFASNGKILILNPGSVMEINEEDKNYVSFYKLTFTIIQLEKHKPSCYEEKSFSNQVEYAVYPFPRFHRLTEELFKWQRNESDSNYFKRQSVFNELLSMLFEHQIQEENSFGTSKTIEQTIEYMHQHYSQQLSVKSLANLANIAPWQYSSIFQTITGQKPLDYLTSLRIKHAKELLQQTNAPLKDIAYRVGFNDEYYFNRRFKQIVGIPPKQFARIRKQKVIVQDWTGHEVEIPSFPNRVIFHGETIGDLSVFDIHPIGGYKQHIDQSFYKNYIPYVQDVAFPIDLDKSSRLKPDLIIFTNADEQQYKKIATIAPTLTHNSWGTLQERITTLGEWLGKKQEAEDWLDQFSKREDKMWQQLQSTLKCNETASVFLFDRGRRLFVMGCIGLATSLYHSSGFQPGELIKNMIADEQGYKEITIESLPDYAGDRIFLLLPENPISKIATEELIQTSLWNSLPAVKNGYVYLVDEKKWNSSDALTREKLLGELPHLLMRTPLVER